MPGGRAKVIAAFFAFGTAGDAALSVRRVRIARGTVVREAIAVGRIEPRFFGSVLLVLADLDHPVFRGSVSEGDVGRLREGMKATLDVGALPGARVEAKLVEISLRSRSANNATVFDVKPAVTPPPKLVLRSGYSAVAHVEVERAADVLVLPERVVDYRDGHAFVRVAAPGGREKEVEVTTGLSDGLTVEIRTGLAEGDEILERIH